MEISARERNCKRPDSARADMDGPCVVSAGDHSLCLYLYAVFLGFFKRKLIECAVIDSSPVHKTDYRALAQRADALFAFDSGDIRGCGSLKDYGVIGSYGESRGLCAARAYLLLNAE